MFNKTKEALLLDDLKKLRLKIDKYQMEIIGANYPNGNKEIEKEIKQMLVDSMATALKEYKDLAAELLRVTGKTED